MENIFFKNWKTPLKNILNTFEKRNWKKLLKYFLKPILKCLKIFLNTTEKIILKNWKKSFKKYFEIFDQKNIF